MPLTASFPRRLRLFFSSRSRFPLAATAASSSLRPPGTASAVSPTRPSGGTCSRKSRALAERLSAIAVRRDRSAWHSLALSAIGFSVFHKRTKRLRLVVLRFESHDVARLDFFGL